MRTKFVQGHATSRVEDRLGMILRREFGDDAVKTQMTVGRWTCDFYVHTISVYVELDGEYWHGLDRPIEQIALARTRTDRKILGTHHSDRMQDIWFRDNGLKLVRITDKELRRLGDSAVLTRIRAAAHPTPTK